MALARTSRAAALGRLIDTNNLPSPFADRITNASTSRAAALGRLIDTNNLPSPFADRITNPILFGTHGLRYRRLEVILTTTIDKLGKAGETVKVAPGHFRNHLMPKMLAVPNIPKYVFLIRDQRKIYQREEEVAVKEVPQAEDKIKEEKIKGFQMAAKRLDNARLSLRKYIKIDTELREPVTKEEIIAEVARQLCVNIHPDNLHLPSPLASLGEFEVPLRLPKDIPRPEGKVQWTLNVKIRRK